MMAGYHSRWTVPDEHRASPEYIEAGARIAFGQAVYDRRMALGLSQSELARRSGLTQPAISRIEGGATLPSWPLLRRLAIALEAVLRATLDEEQTAVEFSPKAA